MTAVESVEQPTPRFTLPTWVVSIVVVLALAASGWLVWWYVFGGAGPREHAVTIDNPNGIRVDATGRRYVAPSQQQTIFSRIVGVQSRAPGLWQVQGPNCMMYVRKQGSSYNFEYHYLSLS